MSMTSMWNRWGELNNKKWMQGGVTYKASTGSVGKCDVAEAPHAIPFGLFPLRKDASLIILRALVKQGRETLYTISNCKKHG